MQLPRGAGALSWLALVLPAGHSYQEDFQMEQPQEPAYLQPSYLCG